MPLCWPASIYARQWLIKALSIVDYVHLTCRRIISRTGVESVDDQGEGPLNQHREDVSKTVNDSHRKWDTPGKHDRLSLVLVQDTVLFYSW